MRNVQDISAAIVTKVQGVSGIVAVYDYKPGKRTNGEYPYATVTLGPFDGRFGDTQRNIREFTFVLEVFQERNEVAFGNQKAERIIREVIDEVLTAFDMDTTLSGMVKRIKPASGDLSHEDNDTGDVRIALFNLEAMTVVDSI